MLAAFVCILFFSTYGWNYVSLKLLFLPKVMTTVGYKDRKGSGKEYKRHRDGFLIHMLDYLLFISVLRLDLFFCDFGNDT